ncbi:MAG TPA: radical SAM protein [Ferruginibacter sp.]|nr:radical SAM protein [Ferruginibacter sp.]
MVIIINSPLFKFRNELYDEDSLPPIGLGYIATNLKNCGYEVELVDAIEQRLPLDSLIEILNNRKPEFVASNIFTTNYELVKELFESLNCKTHIIIGGLSTKQLYSKIMEWQTDNPIDIVTGDGELITTAIVANCLEEQPLFMNGNKRVFQINSNSKYLVQDISNIPLNRSFFHNEPVKHPLGFLEANIVASRGCIYNCTFCAAARSLNADYPVRERDEQSIINELNEIRSKYPQVNSIRVLDDLFLKNNLTVQKATNVFRNFNFQWRSMAHVMTFKNVDDAMMKDLKESGCHELFIGIESGSPAILSSINKTRNVDTILINLTKVLKAGINMKGYFIYGFPGETAADMEMTFKLAQRLKEVAIQNNVNFRTSVFQYRPYHGTQIYHDLEEKGYNLAVQQVQPNQTLSSLVGRLQFNFHSGNYSDVDFDTVHDYIYRTINLNGGQIFAGLNSENQLQKQHL